jgi:multidrug resistance protein MdtO
VASLAQSLRQSGPSASWLWDFLKGELTPYPGRARIVTRMVIAATLVMIVCMTFRIPYAFQGAIYVLLISRETPRATLQSAGTIFLVSGLGAAYLIVGTWFVISLPLFHFLWNISSFFLGFYALSVITNYVAASTFVIMISVGVPLWDRQVSAETNVEDILWLLLASSIGFIVTTAVELAFAHRKAGDDIVLPIAEQLASVQSLLACYAEGCPVEQSMEESVVRLGLRGTSGLRRALRRSDYSARYRTQMGAVVSLMGRLVDTAATLTQLSFEPSAGSQPAFRNLATAIASIRTDLLNRRIPHLSQVDTAQEPSHGVPLLREMEDTVALIPRAFADSQSTDDYLPSSEDQPHSLVAPDAFANPDHFKFALKGCLAASGSYIVYNSIAWPGISTAVTTCLLTGLSTIGASRQKQILRLAGALVGGFVIGMGSQIFILPHLDSIGGFALLFVLVTALASWVMTSSPRLSYFGLQVALAFYLINLQEFAMQTSLSVARDRVVGVLLGLFMMWLVFDQLWGARAGVEMKRAFIYTLRLLAQLAGEPVSGDTRVAIKRGYALRETINANFDKARSFADGVLFEFGPSRQQDLALRDHIRRWQPQLRALFLMRIASLKYRLQLPGFELPEAVRVSQQEYDDRLAGMLEDMADRIEGGERRVERVPGSAFERLEETVQACCAGESQEAPQVRVRSFLALLREIDRLTTSLDEEIPTDEIGQSS